MEFLQDFANEHTFDEIKGISALDKFLGEALFAIKASNMVTDDADELQDLLREADEALSVSSSNMSKKRRVLREPKKYTVRDYVKTFQNHYAEYHDQDDNIKVSFREDYRISHKILAQVLKRLEKFNPKFWTQSFGNNKKPGVPPIVKALCAIRQLATGTVGKDLRQIYNVSKGMMATCFKQFVTDVAVCFADEISSPFNAGGDGVARAKELAAKHELAHGLPGMLGSLDCTHFHWESCPQVKQNAHTNGRYNYPTLVMEAACDSDLIIFHVNMLWPGTWNDCRVLTYGDIYTDFYFNRMPRFDYTLNSIPRTLPYLLVDGIYPQTSIFVKPLSTLYDLTPEDKVYNAKQSAARKDIERAFGMLRGQWKCLHRIFKRDLVTINCMVYTCVILHNLMRKEYVQDLKDAGQFLHGTDSADAVADPEDDTFNLELEAETPVLDDAEDDDFLVDVPVQPVHNGDGVDWYADPLVKLSPTKRTAYEKIEFWKLQAMLSVWINEEAQREQM